MRKFYHALPREAIFCNSLMFVGPGFFFLSLSHTVTVHVEEMTFSLLLLDAGFQFYSDSTSVLLLLDSSGLQEALQ